MDECLEECDGGWIYVGYVWMNRLMEWVKEWMNEWMDGMGKWLDG